ncbi:MAG: hypothetical protein ACAI35_21820 [Candidatus Methylacidiphilales bacterium]|nr:hypothetical protein [Candidatus Methylacidiphilales bacterium]
MNKHYRYCFHVAYALLLLGFLSGLFALAEPDDKSVRIPRIGMWTVNIQYGAPDAAITLKAPQTTPEQPQQRMTKVVITRKNNIRRAQVTWSDGRTTEAWDMVSPRVILVQNPHVAVNDVYVIPAQDYLRSDGVAVPFDEADFTWVSRRVLVEQKPVLYMGKKCYHYKSSITVMTHMGSSRNTPDGVANMTAVKVPVEAWVEAGTGLPVAMINGKSVNTYTFEAAPPGPLILPPAFQKELSRYQAALAAAKRLNRKN